MNAPQRCPIRGHLPPRVKIRIETNADHILWPLVHGKHKPLSLRASENNNGPARMCDRRLRDVLLVGSHTRKKSLLWKQTGQCDDVIFLLV